jgi:hypothetical protein
MLEYKYFLDILLKTFFWRRLLFPRYNFFRPLPQALPSLLGNRLGEVSQRLSTLELGILDDAYHRGMVSRGIGISRGGDCDDCGDDSGIRIQIHTSIGVAGKVSGPGDVGVALVGSRGDGVDAQSADNRGVAQGGLGGDDAVGDVVVDGLCWCLTIRISPCSSRMVRMAPMAPHSSHSSQTRARSGATVFLLGENG